MSTPTPSKMLEMSDEEFSNLNSPPETDSEGQSSAESGTDPEPKADTGTGTDADAETGADADIEVGTGTDADTDADKADKADKDEEADPETPGSETEAEANKGEQSDKKDGTTDSESASTENKDKTNKESADGKSADSVDESKPVDYEAAYKQIMAPFKANGKMIELRSPEEAVQLMQMGANYTRKLQELQPHRKIVMMLDNNGLLDEGKLSYLIDLDKKNPEAIKKLIKDSGIDVNDIDPEVEPAYSPGSHSVSDNEVKFRSVMEDLKSAPSGTETLTEIHSNWDQPSKEALWKSPEIMTIIHQQRETGVYDQIKAEVDRQITLGKIPANTPFLEAYKAVGDAMVEATKQTYGQGQQEGSTPGTSGSPTPQVIATRPAAPKSPLANGDKAKAASPTRSSPRKTEVFKNPLAQSDDEFLKSMEGRL
jgi:hypothetical protein